MRTLSALVTTLTLGVLMAACSSQPDPTAQNVEASVSTQVADSIMTLDEQFLAISKQVPEFAGLYRGKAGEVVARVVPSSNIHLGDQAAANEVRDAIVAVMGTEVFTGQPDAKGATGSTELPIEAAVANNTLSVSLIAATYSFEELHQWFSQVIDLDLEGQMILDANEGKNKVYVGVETDVQADKARSYSKSPG